MAEPKRYYWLKLHKDFFQSKRIKKLRKFGDKYIIIYLKMQLLTLKTDGVITFTHLEDTLAEELALDLDESTEDIQITLDYLLSHELLYTDDNIHYEMPYVKELIGCETAVASRVRKHRALHCNTDVTPVKHFCNGEIEKEIEKDIKKEEDIDLYDAREKIKLQLLKMKGLN